MKPTANQVARAATLAAHVGYTYDELDCQAFVEHCVRQAGGRMDYLGTNDMARRAAWLGTLDEARAQGRLVPGAGLLIREATEANLPARYAGDGLGDFSHVGLYVGENALTDTDKNGRRRACDVVHSSATMGRVAGSTLQNGWTHALWFSEIDYAVTAGAGAGADGANADGTSTGNTGAGTGEVTSSTNASGTGAGTSGTGTGTSAVTSGTNADSTGTGTGTNAGGTSTGGTGTGAGTGGTSTGGTGAGTGTNTSGAGGTSTGTGTNAGGTSTGTGGTGTGAVTSGTNAGGTSTGGTGTGAGTSGAGTEAVTSGTNAGNAGAGISGTGTGTNTGGTNTGVTGTTPAPGLTAGAVPAAYATVTSPDGGPVKLRKSASRGESLYWLVGAGARVRVERTRDGWSLVTALCTDGYTRRAWMMDAYLRR